MSRDFFPGMGQGVAERTVSRLILTDEAKADWAGKRFAKLNPKDPDYKSWWSALSLTFPLIKITDDDNAPFMGRQPDTRRERWADVALRVAEGNTSLDPYCHDLEPLNYHIAEGTILLSGRHLQHGDIRQKDRPMEVFTNCSTAMFRAMTFQLLLSGSGVGSSYDDALMLVDWTKQPRVVCVIDNTHPDVLSGLITGYMTPREALHLYAGEKTIYHMVGDSREGWAEGVEQIEVATYKGQHDHVLILDYTEVRGFGEPIKGMQNRPASGPGPLMGAIANVARLRDLNMPRWKAAIIADHYLAECVLVGGARRAARIATKYWKDPGIFDFIDLKRPIEFLGRSWDEVDAMAGLPQYGSFLWSSNNSVAVDDEFYECLRQARNLIRNGIALNHQQRWAYMLNEEMQRRQYHDLTGETGFLNVSKLSVNLKGTDDYLVYPFAKFGGEDFREMQIALAELVMDHHYQFIVNPCGEIVLFILGAFCVIGDLALFHANDSWEEEQAVRHITRALIRTNLMSSIYDREVKRTNRIGVSLTGILEWAMRRYGLSFKDLIAVDGDGVQIQDANHNLMLAPSVRSMPFWLRMRELANIVDEEAGTYSQDLGVVFPHTRRTIKPAGTTSKLFGLTEGAHLPAMREYLRWVQFRSDDPLVAEYAAKGYPTKELQSYKGTTIVGFPTAPVICNMGGEVTTAGEATMEEQFRWLRLLETFWIGREGGNQVSYTLKYDPKKVSYKEYSKVMDANINLVRAVAVLPQVETLSYEYQPEEPLTKARYEAVVAAINEQMAEDVDKVHIDCAGGACPVDFDK
ncbi:MULTISPECIES: ribonucleoside-diphosphate reductase [unclassified Mesorhizobium]|uniref:ribonucleoside-diphosphate reductase n=1 Tax=unclassified Mesorhizobium TaxID=325217 RepID=UPI00112CC1A6|nr:MULTISPECIES: ribonucleoside-diphosphate reductase [unclassified Mesorhizobium]TPJ51651.1 ribonucleoside-diphosphate reductase [Mesorhizobium sp. B2-6-4]TPN42329.1 ribonucleoside-diphosphate reductase [Mesorhizobium sp. B1-1-6]